MKSELKTFSIVCNIAGFILIVPGLLVLFTAPDYFYSNVLNVVVKIFICIPAVLLMCTAWGVRNSRTWAWFTGLARSIVVGLIGLIMLIANWAIGVVFLAMSAYLLWFLLRDKSSIKHEHSV